MPYTRAARLLGLSVSGLNKQLYGDRAVSRQTELLLEMLERDQSASQPTTRSRGRDRVGAML